MTSPKKKQLDQIEDTKAKVLMREIAQQSAGLQTPAPRNNRDRSDKTKSPLKKQKHDYEADKIGWVLVYNPANRENAYSPYRLPHSYSRVPALPHFYRTGVKG